MKPILPFVFTAALALAQDDVVTINRITPASVEFWSNSIRFDSNRMENAVKGAPHSAETITETVQALADGNRITRTNKSSLARDSEGRTRRESTIEGLGPLGKTDLPVLGIFIDDPVAKTSYTLDPRSKTALKSNSEADTVALKEAMEREITAVQMRKPPSLSASPGDAARMKREAEMAHLLATKAAAPNKVDLGTRNIEGVTAKGTRLTMTIPAGEVGNQLPIAVVPETWHSDEIKTAVLVKHIDPRMGETTTRLTNLRLGKPAKTLFEPPADCKVEENLMFCMAMPVGSYLVRDER